MKRVRIKLEKAESNYFTSEKEELSFVPSGCTLLDCVLGGGYALGRVANIVGDRSTAKTALAMEALINFTQTYPEGVAAYRESEAAFDKQYAKAMGLPIDKIDFGKKDEPLNTVEDFARDFAGFLNQQIKSGQPGIYVLDSLDALSDEAEMDQDIGKGTYGMAKPKMLSIFFRTAARKIEQSKVLLLVISQVRENINAMFGEKYRRSGGKALDFYASQVIWLAHIETLKRTINKVSRPYGIMVRAKCKKNKVGLAFREAEFPFLFGYGVEDLTASIEWLKDVGRLDMLNINDIEAKKYLSRIESMPIDEYRKEQKAVAAVVKTVWTEIETTFLPKRGKYA